MPAVELGGEGVSPSPGRRWEGHCSQRVVPSTGAGGGL